MTEHGVEEKELEAIRPESIRKSPEYILNFALESPIPDVQDAVKHVYMDIEVEEDNVQDPYLFEGS